MVPEVVFVSPLESFLFVALIFVLSSTVCRRYVLSLRFRSSLALSWRLVVCLLLLARWCHQHILVHLLVVFCLVPLIGLVYVSEFSFLGSGVPVLAFLAGVFFDWDAVLLQRFSSGSVLARCFL